MSNLQQWINFSSPTITQDAMAKSLVAARLPYKGFPNYYEYLRADYLIKKNILSSALVDAKLTPIAPAGGFFICADTSSVDVPAEVYKEDSVASPQPMPRDWAVARYFTSQVRKTRCAINSIAYNGSSFLHLLKLDIVLDSITDEDFEFLLTQ